jgi:hypothetical protein
MALGFCSAAQAAINVNVGRYDSVHIVPAPPAVTIDGDLRDWDRSGEFITYRSKEESATHFLKGYMMYDAKNLYIAAHVGDSTPMMNSNNPESEAKVAWRGDCLQVRLSSDPALGWPLKGYTGDSNAAATSDNIAHLEMWYFTPKVMPCLYIEYGMNYHGGVVNPAGFKGAYKKDADGRGYVLEYAISWDLLHAGQHPPQGGDVTATTWQLIWGDAQGRSWSGDLSEIRNPNNAGFVYQDAGSWGKAIYEKAGHLPAGTVVSPEDEKPIIPPTGFFPIRYTIPGKGAAKVSLRITDVNGKTVRWLLGDAQRTAGKNVELWNGLDNDGNPVAPGKYTVQWCYSRGVTAKVVATADNAGDPPYSTGDNKGGWAGDYGTPVAVTANATNVFLAHQNGEASRVLIKVSPRGARQWGVDTTLDLDPPVIAMCNDGKYLYVLQGKGNNGAGKGGFVKISCDTGFNEAIGATGRSTVVMTQPDKNGGVGTAHDPTGIAVNDTTVFVSFAETGQIFGIDKNTAKQTLVINDVEHPRGLTFGPDGRLYVVAGSTLVRMRADGTEREVLTRDLPEPQQVAVAPNGEIFVSVQGDRQQVLRLSSEGKLINEIGVRGGLKVPGPWNTGAMRNPLGVAVTPEGLVWVMEGTRNPKRSSLWQPDGHFVREFIGPMAYSDGSTIDPLQPDSLYASNTKFQLDYRTGKARPVAVVMAEPATKYPSEWWPRLDGMEEGGHRFARVIHFQGRTFLYVAANTWFRALYEIKNDRLVGLWALGLDEHGQVLGTDHNGNSRIDPDEIEKFDFPISYWGAWVADNLDIYTGGSRQLWKISCVGFNADGTPRYDIAGAKLLLTDDKNLQAKYPGATLLTFPGSIEHAMADHAGNVYVMINNGSDRIRRDQGFLDKGHRIVKYSPDGKLLWEYRNVVVSHTASRNTVISKPGETIGAIKFTGMLGRYLTLGSYYGQYHILDSQTGLYITAFTPDTRTDPTLDASTVMTENFNGAAIYVPSTKKYLYAGGDAQARVWEVHGLDDIQYRTSTLEFTAQDRQKAIAASHVELDVKSGEKVIMARGDLAINVDGVLDDWRDADWVAFGVDEKRKARAAAAWTTVNGQQQIKVAFDVSDDSPMLNRGGNNNLLFKSGDAVEFDLSSAEEDAARPDETPLVGDKRILISLVDNQPVVMVYEPKSARTEKHPATFSSPTGKAEYDYVAPLPGAYVIKRNANGYVVEASFDAKELGFTTLDVTQKIRADFGVLFSDKGGAATLTRAMWADDSGEVSVNNDIPTEARLHPSRWGTMVLR